MGSIALTSILLGVGLGILAVSCLTSTVCFGRFVNNFSPIQKLALKVKFDQEKSVYDCSLAITVLGCISFVASLGAIALSVFMGDQTIILIAVGGVAAVFGFGCIVAEGVFTDRIVKHCAIKVGRLSEHDHEKAQEYMIETIKVFYDRGYKTIKENSKGDTNYLEDWGKVSKRLGKPISEGSDEIFTYNNIWSEEDLYGEKVYDDYLKLHPHNGYIYAKSKDDDQYDFGTIVATTSFGKKVSYTYYQNVCWYTKGMTDYKCKKMKYDEVKNENDYWDVLDYEILTLDENIVIGKYINDEDRASYKVSNFPVMYKLLPDGEEIEDYDNKDDKHFKISAKQFVNAAYKEYKSETYDENSRYMAKESKVKDYKDFLKICEFEDYSRLKSLSINRKLKNISKLGESRKLKAESKLKIKSDEDEYMREQCQCFSYGDYPSEIGDFLFTCLSYFDGFDGENRGEVYKKKRNYYIKEAKKEVQAAWSHPYPYDADIINYQLYPLALSQMIIQIIAIVLWAVGKFVGPMLDGSSGGESPSEAEA